MNTERHEVSKNNVLILLCSTPIIEIFLVLEYFLLIIFWYAHRIYNTLSKFTSQKHLSSGLELISFAVCLGLLVIVLGRSSPEPRFDPELNVVDIKARLSKKKKKKI